MYVTTGLSLEDVGLVMADVSDQKSLNEMAAKSNVVINCVGPVSVPSVQNMLVIYSSSFMSDYSLTSWCLIMSLFFPPEQYQLYGEPVVQACVENGANHVDISGETLVCLHYLFF